MILPPVPCSLDWRCAPHYALASRCNLGCPLLGKLNKLLIFKPHLPNIVFSCSGVGLRQLFFFFFAVLGLELRAFTLRHSPIPIFCDRVFWDRASQTICPGWFRTVILLIFASWVARMTGVSHWCLEAALFFRYPRWFYPSVRVMNHWKGKELISH
jgi:hypothetical protein